MRGGAGTPDDAPTPLPAMQDPNAGDHRSVFVRRPPGRGRVPPVRAVRMMPTGFFFTLVCVWHLVETVDTTTS
jgi:hypothetical protein